MNFVDKMAISRVTKLANQAEERKIISTDNPTEFLEFFRNFGFTGSSDNLSECTYLTCLKTLYETLGKLNFDILKDEDGGTKKDKTHELYKILRYRPNPHMTPTTFKQLMEFNRNHYGNAYAYIMRDNKTAELKSLIPINPRNVKILVDDNNSLGFGDSLFYQVTSKNGEKAIIHERDMLHFKFSLMNESGLVGRSVQEVLAQTMGGAKASQAFLNNLYEKGMTASAVVEYAGDMNDEKLKRLRDRLEEFSSGVDNAGRILPLPSGSKLHTIDLKLADSQFFELRKYNALQIASVFGIKPTQLNDFDKSSYATSEAQNLSFYVDTVLSILRQYEEEMAYKLISEEDLKKGYHIKANVSSMLRADLKTQAEILTMYVQNGVLSSNEAREKIDQVKNEHGNTLMANGNYIPLSMIGEQYKK